MSVLRTIEHTIEGLVERTFGRAFRSHLQPVELARKLAREMEQNKTVSVSQVYVPNEYTVYLSNGDMARFSSFEASLTAELGSYLASYARAEGLTLLSQPEVTLRTDDDLRVGEFGIACRTVDPPADDAAAPPAPAEHVAPVAVREPEPLAEAEPQPEPEPEPEPLPEDAVSAAAGGEEGDGEPEPAPGAEDEAADGGEAGPLAETALEIPSVEAPQVPDPADAAAALGAAALGAGAAAAPEPPAPPKPAPRAPVRPAANQALQGVSGTQILSAEEARAAGLSREALTLTVGGRRMRVTKRITTIGRSRDNDIVIGDPNVSRQHAEIRHVGIDYYLVDLDSTNGLEVNGRRTKRHALTHGDVVTVGRTQIRVEAG